MWIALHCWLQLHSICCTPVDGPPDFLFPANVCFEAAMGGTAVCEGAPL